MSFEDPRRTLSRHGLSPKRSFSQNFLVAAGVVDKIADAVAPSPATPVVELGPGPGTLTFPLIERGARVTAVERDRDMAAVLAAERRRRGLDEAVLSIVEADAAQVDLAAIGGGERVVVTGNLPYAATGAIFRNLVERVASVERAVVMVQREVRDRLCAVPGTKAFGALTVFVSNVYEVRPLFLVSPGSFHPPPKVTSAVVSLTAREAPQTEVTQRFEAVVRAAFGARRKTLRNALRTAAVAPPEPLDEALAAAAIDPRRRGETLTVAELGALAAAIDAAVAITD